MICLWLGLEPEKVSTNREIYRVKERERERLVLSKTDGAKIELKKSLTSSERLGGRVMETNVLQFV